jgi:hypothetical protein
MAYVVVDRSADGTHRWISAWLAAGFFLPLEPRLNDELCRKPFDASAVASSRPDEFEVSGMQSSKGERDRRGRWGVILRTGTILIP